MWLCLFVLSVWGSLEAGAAAPGGGRTSGSAASLVAVVLVVSLGREGGKARGFGSSWRGLARGPFLAQIQIWRRGCSHGVPRLCGGG
jgi:hypothetical protein